MTHRQAGLRWTLAAALAFSSPLVRADLLVYSTALSGAAEATPNASTGTGTATVRIDTVQHAMLVDVMFDALFGLTTASHIHCCTAVPNAGTAGVATQTPTFIGFPSTVGSGSYTHTFDLTQAASWNAGFLSARGGSVAQAEADLLAGLASETAYLNIHTDLFPGGEIRGFLVRALPEPASFALVGLGLGGLMLGRRRSHAG